MCTGQGLFLTNSITLHESYSTILERLKNGATFVDIGTFLGQELRRLVVNGAPSENMYAIDIVNHWDIGYDMFRDKDKFHARYIEADILHPKSALQELNGKMDIIWVCHVLHQWTWEGQVSVAKNLVALSHKGTLLAGYEAGHEVATHVEPNHLMKGESFLHDPASFVKMWDQVGKETDTKWETKVQYRALSEMGWEPHDFPTPGRRVIHFVAERLE
jgi:SAM-dependent methyltransferase